MTTPPVSFSQKASATKSGSGGYPIQISAKDLDDNFAYATMEISDIAPQGQPQPFAVDEITGPGGHTQRRLLFRPAPPMDGKTYVLGFARGDFTWIATEAC